MIKDTFYPVITIGDPIVEKCAAFDLHQEKEKMSTSINIFLLVKVHLISLAFPSLEFQKTQHRVRFQQPSH